MTPGTTLKDWAKVPPLMAHTPIATTHFGSAIWSYILLRVGAIFQVRVPATSIRSAWRGEARKSSIPNREMSKREAAVAAFKHNRSFSYGGTVKAIYEKVHDFSATGIAVDLAVKYSSDRDRYSAGLMVQNLGRQLSALGTEKYRLPLMVRAGGAMRPRSIPVVVAVDGIFMVDNNPVVALGIEYFEFQPFYARMGWNSFGSNYRGVDSDDIWAGFSMGVGFDHNQLHIAYAYSPAADLGTSHRATVTWSK